MTADPRAATMIKAIETSYAGCRFRSRLEARYAVLFDHLGIAWEYELQGYLVGPGRKPYLPDFWLPGHDLWAEVKGDAVTADLEVLAAAAAPAAGLPGESQPRMIFLGSIPRVPSGSTAWHTAVITSDHADLRGLLVPVRIAFNGNGLSLQEPPVPPSAMRQLGDLTRLQPGYFTAHVSPDGNPGNHQAYAAARSARFEHGQHGG